MSKARVIALYLPQYHPVEENDRYWGKGFTEWTNVARAKPLFKGHDQPRIPADLGFYDLRLAEVRTQQAEMAAKYGVEGFCYWHYWFGEGKEVLQRPFDEVVKSGEPDFPFCLGWATHDWTTKTWEQEKAVVKNTVIFEQRSFDKEDFTAHFYRLLDAFRDKRYIMVDGKLLFIVLLTDKILPYIKEFMETWRVLAVANNLPGFHFVASVDAMPTINAKNIGNIEKTVQEHVDSFWKYGFDAIETVNHKYAELKAQGKLHKVFSAAMRRAFPFRFVEKYDYKDIINNFYSTVDYRENVYPQICVGWDRTPRSGGGAILYVKDTPEKFKKAVENALKCVEKKQPEHRILFLNSWNEWGEGAYMEPDLRYGRGKLEALRDILAKME